MNSNITLTKCKPLTSLLKLKPEETPSLISKNPKRKSILSKSNKIERLLISPNVKTISFSPLNTNPCPLLTSMPLKPLLPKLKLNSPLTENST
jgi:hypothetical protein